MKMGKSVGQLPDQIIQQLLKNIIDLKMGKPVGQLPDILALCIYIYIYIIEIAFDRCSYLYSIQKYCLSFVICGCLLKFNVFTIHICIR